MTQFRIAVDMADVGAQAVAIINAAVLPRLNQAVRAVVTATQANWSEAVHRAKLWQGEKDAYAASIQAKMVGDFEGLVWSDYKYAREIDDGRPARDLKKYLDTSSKVRRTKDGRRFLIIPFRHTLKSMPAAVQSAAKMLTKSQVTGMGLRVSGQVRNDLKGRWGTVAQDRERRGAGVSPHSGFLVSQRKYLWGGRLPDGLALKEASHHKTDRFAGMVRMNASSGKSRSSVYLTFRTMMEGSPGWVTKPVPGVFQMPELAREIEPFAQSSITEALRKMPAMS